MVQAAEKIDDAPEIRIVQQEPGKLTLEGSLLPPEGSPWSVRAIDDQRFLVVGARAKTGAKNPGSSGVLTSAMYKQLFLGLIEDSWSGCIYVDTFHGVKRIFLYKGNIVFGASTLIDDRLGEVLYREARITIDQLTYAASQVTKSQRFGQILVAKGGVSNTQLWGALVAQVQQIVRSTFMVNQVFFEIETSDVEPATEIAMTISAKEMVHEMFCYGVGFRSFLDRLTPSSQVVPPTEPAAFSAAQVSAGTFLGDFLEIIANKPTIEQILNASKLIDLYTIAAVYQLSCLGLCKVLPECETKSVYSTDLSPVRNKIEAYSYVLQSVIKAFTEAGKEFPKDDLKVFVCSHDQASFPFIYLQDDLRFARESIAGMFAQCQAQPSRTLYFLMRIETLIQFLFQIAGDHLKFSVAQQLRQEYRSVST